MGKDSASTASRSNTTSWSRNHAPLLATTMMLVMVFSGLGVVFAMGTISPAMAHAPLPVAHVSTVKGTGPTVGVAHVSPVASANAAATLGDRAALQAKSLAASKADGVPTMAYLPPNFMQQGISKTGNVLTATAAPDANPVGISTLGVDDSSGTPVGKVFNSTSWEGSITINAADAFTPITGGPDFFGVQLNTVLQNVTVGNNSGAGVYWTQNVIEYSPSQQTMYIVDNIWNFSSPGAAEPASTFYCTSPVSCAYNGTPSGGAFYYDYFPLKAVLPLPFTVDLWTNSSIVPYTGVFGNTNYNSAVTFGLVIPGVYANNYDRVEFNSTANQTAIPQPQFQVSGNYCTPYFPAPYCLPFDSELILGGPGGGSNVNFNGFNGTLSLSYIPIGGSANVAAPYALNTGWNTGETAVGVAEHWGQVNTVYAEGGPSIPAPFWGSSPTGSRGTLTLTGAISPANAFVFVQSGSSITTDGARWAPATTAPTYTYHLPPGTYTGWAGYSNYQPASLAWTGVNGATSTQAIALVLDLNAGIYTPLYGWSSAQVAAQEYTGTQTVWNNEYSALSPYFLQMNDYLFPTFAGVMFSGWYAAETAHANLNQSAPFTVDFSQSAYWSAVLPAYGVTATTNQLNIYFLWESNAAVWNSALGGWTSANQNGWFTASIGMWDATNTVIGHNTFTDSGTGLFIYNDTAVGGTNTIWGNWFSNTPLAYAAPSIGLQDWEGHDTILNNYFGTLPEAASPAMNFWTALPQTNLNDWNLSGATPVPAATVFTAGEYTLTGSIVGAPMVCGNNWIGNTPSYTGGLPYNAQGAIAAGGDYCPGNTMGYLTSAVTFTESGLKTGTPWSIAITTDQSCLVCSVGEMIIPATASGATATSFTIGGLPSGWYNWSLTAAPLTYVGVPNDGQVFIDTTGATTVNVAFIQPTITISSPTQGQAYAAPEYNITAAWSLNNSAAWASELSVDVQIMDSTASTNVTLKTISKLATVTSYDFLYSSYDPQCYNVVVGVYNGTNPGHDQPSGAIPAWPVYAEQPFCVQAQSDRASIVGVQPSGNVTIYYVWSAPGAAAAQLTVWQVGAGTPLVYTTGVGNALGLGSGVVVLILQPAVQTTYAANLTVTDAYGATTSYNGTFSVAAPLTVKPVYNNVTVPAWYNTTSTTNYYYNTTAYSPAKVAGLDPNVLGAILLEVGIIVGALIGIIIGMMMWKRKPASGGMGGSADMAAGGAFTCPACDASFADQRGLDEHKRTAHGQ